MTKTNKKLNENKIKSLLCKRTVPKLLPSCGILPQSSQSTVKGAYANHLDQLEVQCWAHSKSGTRCSRIVGSREGEPFPVPYCWIHMKCGDGALKVVNHPFAGKCLVTRFDLPAKYRIAFWGLRGRCSSCAKDDRAISFYPPNKTTGRNKDKNGTRRINYNGVLNPGGTGDLIQYAACPGPNERQNMRSTFQYWGLRNGHIGGLEFITLEKVPKNHQLCHWYGPGWWSTRGVKRRDISTKRHPAPSRVDKDKNQA